MIETLLIANRGEIACRIIRACRALGVRAVAAYSDADRHARHVREADEAVYIGGSAPGESYLASERLIAAAKRAGADAVHPGFGFLAENADFARACADAGLVFVGPSPEAIAAMGSKRAAKALAIEAGVPVIPGHHAPDADDAALLRAAPEVGFPLMVKAAAGGGGKGMRLVHRPDELPEALASARREAAGAFGSDELILERALTRPRHIEIQVLGDAYGHIIHLGERECSIQRRHQKIIEESPAPGMTPDLRAAMGEAAVTLARAVGYQGAGTVEFLLDADGQFYFLEMNTRLQVEHPVTELAVGIDLVQWQIRVADGERLTLSQDDLRFGAHAVEARLYAEDPASDFLPATGRIHLWRAPTGEGVRVDHGLNATDSVSIYYDPMLAKLIAQGPTRQIAIRRLIRALETTALLGVTSNRAFLLDLLRSDAFQAGATHTGFIAEHLADWRAPAGDVTLALCAAALIEALGGDETRARQLRAWRNNPNRPEIFRYQVAGEMLEVRLTRAPGESGDEVALEIAGSTRRARLIEHGQNEAVVSADGHRQRVIYARDGARWWMQTRAGVVTLDSIAALPEARRAADAGGSLRAPMPGAVIAVMVEAGQAVEADQPLMKLEAMKMEHTIRAAAAGVVEAVYYAVGDTVEADAQLLRMVSA